MIEYRLLIVNKWGQKEISSDSNAYIIGFGLSLFMENTNRD